MPLNIKYANIDFTETKRAARMEGLNVKVLADLLDVRYDSLAVILCGRYGAHNPDKSRLVRKVAQGLDSLGLLRVKEEGQ